MYMLTNPFRMLGYKSGKPTNSSHFGDVLGTFAMDDVQCAGREDSLLDCQHNKWHDCGAGEAAGVICSRGNIFAEKTNIEV